MAKTKAQKDKEAAAAAADEQKQQDAATGDGPAAEGEPGTAPTDADGADTGEPLQEPSGDEDGAEVPADQEPAEDPAAKAEAENAKADERDDTPVEVVPAPDAPTPFDPTPQAEPVPGDANYTGDTPSHPLPVRESSHEQEMTGFEQVDAVEPTLAGSDIADPDLESGRLKGLTKEQLKAFKK
jgi:hypothetical protein